MNKNLGLTDRLIRMTFAGLLALAFLSNTLFGTLGVAAIFLAGILFVTSIVGVCPIYRLFRIKTL